MFAKGLQCSVFAAGALLVLNTSMPVFALEADDVAGQLEALLERNGLAVAWSAASANGNNVILEGVKAGPAGDQIEIGTVLLSNVAETDGGYYVETVSLPDYTKEKDGNTISLTGFVISGLTLSDEETDDIIAKYSPYEAINLDSLRLTGPQGEIFSLDNFYAETEVPETESPVTYTGGAERFVLNSTAFPEAEARAAFAALGYSVVEGSLAIDGVWNPADGRHSLDEMVLDIKDAGQLSIGFEISGATPEFLQSLQTISQKMQEGDGDKESEGIAMLGLMQQITFHSASIRYEDASLTGKVLEFVAMQQGMKASDIANQAKAMVPFALMPLQNPQFATEVTMAITSFLDNPKNIEITAEPATPLPVALLFASGMSAPEQLPAQLGVKVQANQ